MSEIGEHAEPAGSVGGVSDYPDRLLASDGRDESGRVNPIPLGLAMLGEVSEVLVKVSVGRANSDPDSVALTVSDLEDFLPLLNVVCEALVSGAAEFYPWAVGEPRLVQTESGRLIRAALSDLCEVVTEFNTIAELSEGSRPLSPAVNVRDLAGVVARLGEIRFGLVTGMALADKGCST